MKTEINPLAMELALKYANELVLLLNEMPKDRVRYTRAAAIQVLNNLQVLRKEDKDQ